MGASTIAMGASSIGHESLGFMSFTMGNYISVIGCFRVAAAHFLPKRGSM
jgi:hypothetical protein